MTHAAVPRRKFLHAALAGSCTLAGLPARAAQAAAPKVMFGFPGTSVSAQVGQMVLKAMAGLYEPDLGLELNCLSGGAGMRSVEAFLKTPNDGSSVLLNPSSVMTLMPQVRKISSPELLRDVIPVASVAEFTFAFTVGPAVPPDVRTMNDYVRWLRQYSTTGAYGIPGVGSAAHFVGLSMARLADLPLTPVSYLGQGPEMKDLLSGALPAAMAILGSEHEAQRDDRIRPLAVSSARRWPLLPDVPTLRELGLSDVDVSSTLGFFLPAGAPDEKVKQLNAAVQQALRSEAVNQFLKDRSMRPAPGEPKQFAALLAEEGRGWGGVVQRERFAMQN